MSNSLVRDMQRREAEFSRDVAYILEDVEDREVDMALEYAEASLIEEDAVANYDAVDTDIDAIMEHMDEIPMDEDAEVQRILESTDGLTFDQMVGLDPIED